MDFVVVGQQATRSASRDLDWKLSDTGDESFSLLQ
jgi:hypothetical protein